MTYFRNLFENQAEAALELGAPEAAVDSLARYLYNDAMNLSTVEGGLDLYKLAHELQFGSLKTSVPKYIIKNMSAETTASSSFYCPFVVADTHGIQAFHGLDTAGPFCEPSVTTRLYNAVLTRVGTPVSRRGPRRWACSTPPHVPHLATV